MNGPNDDDAPDATPRAPTPTPEPTPAQTYGPSTRADRDLDLLARPELRSVRLQLEYLKPQLALEDRGIVHTIVVFGSTRLRDPDTAASELAAAESAAREGDDQAQARVERARAVLERSRYYAIGRELGRLIGCCGHGPGDDRLVVMTGGGPGGMEAANRGAHDVGARSAGLNIALPLEQHPNPYITPELCFEFRYFGLRKLHFMLRARALVVLPGGYGTLDELFEALCLVQTRKRAPLPVVLVGQAFWRRAIDFDFLLAEEMIAPEDLALFSFAESADETWQRINEWYAERGRTVFDPSPDDDLAEANGWS